MNSRGALRCQGAAVAAVLLLLACTGEDAGQDNGPTARPTVDAGGSPAVRKPAGRKRQPRFDPSAVEIALRSVAGGFTAPLFVTHAGDGSERLFVVEQGGLIRILAGGEVNSEPFLDLTSLTEASGEQGLLGLAFHPAYQSNGRFFVNYTDEEGDTVVAEYRSPNPGSDVADASSARVLLRIDQPFSNHNGGALSFGPDGYLYVATGDGGSGGDPMGNGQSLTTHLGKLLRIDVDSGEGGTPYGVPPDNPFVDRPGARPEIWAYGLRNPWRFSFDGDELWIGDVGQSALEEVNRAPAARAGLNYGWNVMEGVRCYEIDPCDSAGLYLPIATYSHGEGCSVTGGYVYRGVRFETLSGGYFFGDYCSGRIWALAAAGPDRQKPVPLLDTDVSISSFGVDEDGELYVSDIASGRILQVIAR